MKTSRIVIAVALLIVGAGAVTLGASSDAPSLGIFGWIGLACMLVAQAIGAVVGVREFIAERAERRSEDAVREVPASNGIQVLGTILHDEEGDVR
jgi:hypothetical protein